MMCIIALPTWSLQQPKRGESHLPPGPTAYVLGVQLLHPAVAQGDSIVRGEDNHGPQDAEALGLQSGTELPHCGYRWYY